MWTNAMKVAFEGSETGIARGVSQQELAGQKDHKKVSQFSSFHNASFCEAHFCHQKRVSIIFFRMHDKTLPELKIAVATAVHTIDSKVCSRVMDGFQNCLSALLVKEGGHFESLND
ncbi:hypothetical protein AVEN_218993-1 [Araneus ventricosus]|uniref:Uncharacterized protein n=1 Tax=Araneus ventricosus TaxID=182803 RepID=A0A4Y2CEW6_ARAVE|nr:hypothetical protein AVEN_218993-1 [Araneus ventricosus]